MAIARVSARGQLTLPRDVRKLAGIKPGDSVDVQVLGRRHVRVVLLPKLTPRELGDRYPIDIEIDEANDREAWQAQVSDIIAQRRRPNAL
jgi:AbrB family looped-hinge helix DNA binding protein